MGIQLIAMAVLAAFYGCYVVKMICQKKKGIQTDQIGKGKAGFVKLIEVTMKISAFLVLGAGIISIVLDASNGPISIRIIGAVVSAAGTAVFITAVLTMRDSWRAGVSPTDKTELVTNGIYQFSRNPAFLGFDLLSTGGCAQRPYLPFSCTIYKSFMWRKRFCLPHLGMNICNIRKGYAAISV